MKRGDSMFAVFCGIGLTGCLIILGIGSSGPVSGEVFATGIALAFIGVIGASVTAKNGSKK